MCTLKTKIKKNKKLLLAQNLDNLIVYNYNTIIILFCVILLSLVSCSVFKNESMCSSSSSYNRWGIFYCLNDGGEQIM